MTRALTKQLPAMPAYAAACKALAKATHVDEVKRVRNQAEAIRAYAHQAKNRTLEIDAAELRLRAERRLGEMICEQKETVGLNRGAAGGGHKDASRRSFKELHDQRPTLMDIGVDKKLSMRAQKLAAVPQTKFAELLTEWRERVTRENERVTTTLLREGEQAQQRESYEARKDAGGQVADLQALVDAGHTFGAILADPPWEFVTYSKRGKGRSPERHYDTMTLDQLKAMPIGALAAKDCELFLWGVWPRLPDALDLIATWGFEYKTLGFIWLKTTREVSDANGWPVLDGEAGVIDADFALGPGYHTRANTEPCLIATRGKPKRLDAGVRQIILAPRGEHSQKPPETHRRIAQLVGGPYLELFGRALRDGWTVWGNEVPAPLMADTERLRRSRRKPKQIDIEELIAAEATA